MAAASAEENGETAWELSKENVQPVKTGRNVNCIAAVLQPSREDMDRLMKEKQVFEERIIACENSEDPIEAWDSYLKWTIQNFPSGGNDLTLLYLLQKFIGKFRDEKYKNDVRYLHAWLKLAEIMKDPFETFSFMNTEGIGRECAEFYIAWADEYEKYRDVRRADKIYNDGDENCTQQRELLQKRHMEFQLRVARGMLNNRSEPSEEEEPESKHRTALNSLSGRGKHHTVGTQRKGRALQPIQGPTSFWGQSAGRAPQKSAGFEIYEDAAAGVTVMGEMGKWASAPSSAAAKENTQNPGRWKGVKVKQKHIQPRLMPSMPVPPACEFTVYEDEVEASGYQNQPHKIATNIESILSEKKETRIDFSNIKSAVDEMPVHEGNVTSGYDLHKVYTVMGEMQFEEVRAAHWRKRQKIQAEQAAIVLREKEHQERARMMKERELKLEEERRRLYDERMRLLEQERKMMELERMQMQQKRSDLENRLKQIKILEKSAKTVEEERMLQIEEEDITIQLNAVRRNIRRASMKDCKEIEASIAHAPLGNGEIEFCNETRNSQTCDIEDEMRPHQQMFNPAKPTSANNSLNHSKRSQPSPTVNTKEAMSQIDEWFQKPLDDGKFTSPAPDYENEDVLALKPESSYSFKPINEPTPTQPLFRNENADPFHIFTDDDNDVNVSSSRPVVQKKGLSARPATEIKVKNEAPAAQSQEDDKTEFCFDDVTVAGSHFAAKAHMASTPFCNKTDKLQGMSPLDQLSRIQPEVTENLAICEDQPISSEQSTSFIPLSQPDEDRNYQSQAENEMFLTLEKGDGAQACNDAKQLSPIMEASNESEKSSVMGITKMSRPDTESDKSHHPLNQSQLHLEPLKMKSFGSVLSQTPTAQSPASGEKRSDVFCFDDYLSNGSIDCNLWDEMGETTSSHKHLSKQDAFQYQDTKPPTTCPEALNNTEAECQEVNEICAKLDATSVLQQHEDFASPPSQCQLSNMIPDPWNVELLNSILKRQGSIVPNGEVTTFQRDGEMVPKLKKGAHINLGGRNCYVGHIIGEGAYAKVFDVTTDESQKSLVVKAQFPSCPWELYAISHVRDRLLKNQMEAIAGTIIGVDSAYFFEDGSLLFMPFMNKGTLLDLVNAKKGTEKIKNIVAMWIAYQVMSIVHGLHSIGFIHGDIKPDNFMVVPEDLVESYECCKVAGLKLIDFGQAIDMTEMPQGATFLRCCPTSAFTCIQMQNKEPWNYHTDFYGIAGTLHVVLFGSYMTVRQGKNELWGITNKIKRWHNCTLWKDFFDTLLNFPTPTEERPVTLADSPLPRLIAKIASLLEESAAEMDSVVTFLQRS